MPTGQYGQIYGQGVKYLKVNRYDSGGLDRSDYLGQLTNLTINYDDLGPITYNIVTTQEQDTYFVYGIQTRNQSTSSVNFNIISQSIGVEKTGSVIAASDIKILGWFGDNGLTPGFSNVLSGNSNVVAGSPGAYTYFTLFRTPNTELSLLFTGSYNSEATPTDVQFSFCQPDDDSGNSGAVTLTSYTLPTSAGTLQFKYDFLNTDFVEGSYYLGIKTGGGNRTFTNIKVYLSQSQAPNFDYPVLTIFDPEFIDWDYNDYNALFGNAETPQFSSQLMDVDYTSTFTTPVNFDLIISGTADRAQVQDSNYNSYTWSALRYWGSRYNSFNPYNYVPQSKIEFSRLGGNTTTNIGNFNDLSLDGSGYGELPAVEQNQTYIAYFDGVGGTGPEIIGQTAYFIKYLIDINGNIVNPEPGNSALYNLLDNFEPSKNAVVKLIGSDPTLTASPNDDALTGLHKITHVGRITPILLSQSGSSSLDYATTMSFALLGDILNPLDVGVLTSKFTLATTFLNEPLDYVNFDFQNTQYSNNGSWSRITGGIPISASYRLNSSSIEAGSRIRFNTQFYIQRIGSVSGINTNFRYRIIKNNNTDNVFYESDWFPIPYDNNISLLKQSVTPWFNAEDNDVFKVQIKYSNEINPDSNLVYPRIQATFNTYFMVEQETQPLNDFIAGVNTVTSSYWTIGDYSGATTVLTASGELFNIYQQQGIYQIPPTESLQFGFSPISTPFYPILPGDYIRFDYIPDAVYNITNVTTIPENPDQSASLFLTTVPPITSGSNLDNFVLYRIVNDGTYIILDVNKPEAGNSFTGIIQPEYVSQELTDKYSDIIQDLTQRGLIS